jgi:preprotein translocase subunit SecA
MVTSAIENAQKKVKAHRFEIRKQLLDYDDDRQQIVQHFLSAGGDFLRQALSTSAYQEDKARCQGHLANFKATSINQSTRAVAQVTAMAIRSEK